MTHPRRGLYEQLVTAALREQLADLPDNLRASHRDLRSAEAADRLALHVARQLAMEIASYKDDARVEDGVALARALIAQLRNADLAELPDPAGKVLHAVVGRRPDGRQERIDKPLIPLLDTTLLTNAPGEPTLWSQLRSEIDSADAIDVVMAFIRRSGISPLLDDAAPALPTRAAAARAHHDLHRLDRAARARPAGRRRRRHPRLLRRQHDATARQGVAVSPALRLLDRLRRLVEPDALGAGDRAGVERPGLGRHATRTCVDKFSAVFESYWASGDFVAVRRGRSSSGSTTRPADGTEGPHVHAQPDRAAPAARSRSGCSS